MTLDASKQVDGSGVMRVEVAYALPDKQKIYSLQVPVGATLWDAVRQSAIEQDFPGVALEKAAMGVFGKREAKPKDRVLKAGDRVEVYRPLKVDPKVMRKQRAEKLKAERKPPA